MTDNGEVVKFVYGDGLIGEERSGAFRTYHFDYRGSTVAISNDCGSVSDRFEYDSYGQMTSHTGSGSVIFGYNGRDGVVTDENGLIYMRARYYAPSLKRFVNADIIAGEISNAVTLNRYAYANGNPVSNVDPFGLSADNKGKITFKGNTYDIYYPLELDGGTYFEEVWKQCEKTKLVDFTRFEWEHFIATLELPNVKSKADLLPAFGQFAQSVSDNLSKITLEVRFYKNSSGKRRASIAVIDSGQADLLKETSYAKGVYHSISRNEAQKYVEATLPKDGSYKISVDYDSSHLNNDIAGYLWFDGENYKFKPNLHDSDVAKIKNTKTGIVYYATEGRFSKESRDINEFLGKSIGEELKKNELYVQ